MDNYLLSIFNGEGYILNKPFFYSIFHHTFEYFSNNEK